MSFLIASLAASGFGASLDGTVKTASSSGLSGVVVSLAKNGSSATTNTQGVWTLTTTSGARHRSLISGPVSPHLSIREGRLTLSWNGVGADGRALPGAMESGVGRIHAGRAMAAIIDTLLFKISGTVKARLPVGTYDSTGILTVIDTATGGVDEGSSVTTWSSGCRSTKVECTAGTWKAAGPSPDRSGYKLVKESAHFAIYTDGNVTDADATTALTQMEDVTWKNMFESNLFAPEPYCKDATKYKASIHIHEGDGLMAGGWGGNPASSTRIGVWMGPGGLKDHWGIAHEFNHAWQYYWGYNNGLGCPSSNTCGWVAESHSNYVPHQLPEYKNDVHCSEMLANTPHLGLGNARDMYCNWQFMEFLKDKHCPEATNDIWTTSGPDPFTNIQKSRGWTISQLNDFFGEWAMHNVVWDYKATPGAFRTTYSDITKTDKAERMRRLMPLESLDSDWATNHRFVSPYYGAPQRFGYNVVRLYPTAGASTVTVKFRGINQSGSNADFRWGLVATNAGFTTARYSKMQRGLDANVTFKVVSGEPLFLVVMATPSVFQTLVYEQDYNTVWRHPYMIELANAWPAGFQNGVRDACPSGTQRHSNGGGCAPSSTPTTVYVGPYATILPGGNASGNARIEDQAIVANGTVSGGTVGALSIIGETGSQWGNNAFTVSGGTVRTAFYPLGFFEANQSISGGNLYGDVETRGAGLSMTSGNMTGFADAETKRGSATDKNSKGPWTWRP